MEDKTVRGIAEKHAKDWAQVLVRWSLQKGYVARYKGREANELDIYLCPNLLLLVGSNRIRMFMTSSWMRTIWPLWMDWMKELKAQAPGIRLMLISDGSDSIEVVQ